MLIEDDYFTAEAVEAVLRHGLRTQNTDLVAPLTESVMVLLHQAEARSWHAGYTAGRADQRIFAGKRRRNPYEN